MRPSVGYIIINPVISLVYYNFALHICARYLQVGWHFTLWLMPATLDLRNYTHAVDDSSFTITDLHSFHRIHVIVRFSYYIDIVTEII